MIGVTQFPERFSSGDHIHVTVLYCSYRSYILCVDGCVCFENGDKKQVGFK